MRDISNTTGPIDYGEKPGETGNSPASFKNALNEMIQRANAVPILHVFKMYGIRLDVHNRKTTCPFKFHKGGKESTPSFLYYPETNSFYCFGCGTGSRASDFVMHMDNSERPKAAAKILEKFNADVDEDLLYEGQNVAERAEIMAEFSNAVLEFRQKYESEHAFKFIEYLCWVYDRMNLIHTHDNDALRGLNARLIDWIQSYNSSVNLAFEDKYLKVICTL